MVWETLPDGPRLTLLPTYPMLSLNHVIPIYHVLRNDEVKDHDHGIEHDDGGITLLVKEEPEQCPHAACHQEAGTRNQDPATDPGHAIVLCRVRLN